MSSISKNNSFIDKLPHNHVTYPHNVLSSFMEKNLKIILCLAKSIYLQTFKGYIPN